MLHGVTEGCAIQKEVPRWKYLRLYLRTNSLVNTHFQCFTVNHWKLWCFHLIWMSAHKLRCRRNLGLVVFVFGFFFSYLLMAIWYHNFFLVQLQIIYDGGGKFCVSLSITHKEQPQCQAAHYNPWRQNITQRVTQWCPILQHRLSLQAPLLQEHTHFQYCLQTSLGIDTLQGQISHNNPSGRVQARKCILGRWRPVQCVSNSESPWSWLPRVGRMC